MLKPFEGLVYVVDEDQFEEINSNGIIILNGKAKREKIARATILSVASDLEKVYNPGDTIVYPKYCKREQTEKEFFLRHDDILGKMEE